MREAIALALAAAVGVSSVFTGAAPASAASLGVAPAAMERAAESARVGVEPVQYWRGRRHSRYGHGYYGPRHPYYGPRSYYYGPRYGYYGRRYYRRDNDSAVAAGILGLAAGAILGGALANRGYSSDRHAYCASKYRSYDPATGTYLGYDGYRHPCR